MNCFTHALPFMDDAHFMVGCCLPDWMSACDRKCRLREKKAAEFIDHENAVVAKLAQGVMQHHHDDDWFHRGAAFNELSMKYSLELCEVFDDDRTMRTGLIGHIIIEMFLDAWLNARNPGKLESYYQQVEAVDPEQVQSAINLFATRPTDKLIGEIERFSRARFLFEYESDEGVIFRINKVLSRVGLPTAPASIATWTPSARQRVYERAGELLAKYAVVL